MELYDIVKLILTIIYAISSLFGFIFIAWWIAMFLSKNPDKKKRNNIAKVVLISFIVTVISMFAHYIIALKQYSRPLDISTLPTFYVTSGDLHDGAWDEKIGAKNGNLSPELSWNKVTNAEKYAIVMIDYDGNNWLHWFSIIDSVDDNKKSNNINFNNLDYSYVDRNKSGDNTLNDKIIVASGTFNNFSNGYVGPYPPSGTHNYTIYVFALIGDTYSLDIQLDKGGTDLQSIVAQLDSGLYTDYHNIVAVSTLEGRYSSDE